MSKFAWPTCPTTYREFIALMQAIDKDLTEKGLKPFQRPMHVGHYFWEGFGWNGSVVPTKDLANQPGFVGEVLTAKAHRWYDEVYADQIMGDFAYGFAPARIGNSLRRVRAGLVFGSVQLFLDRNISNRGVRMGGGGARASFNVLCSVEGLPQGLVDLLPEPALKEFFEFYVLVHQSLQWRDGLPASELFNVARADYDESTVGVLGGRYVQARWSAEQAVEKTMKWLLELGGTAFPAKGGAGHDLVNLGKLLADNDDICLPVSALSLAS